MTRGTTDRTVSRLPSLARRTVLRAAMGGVAGAWALATPALAQTVPPGAILDLGTGTPPTVGVYTQYSATVTAASSGRSYALFAFREDPAYFRFDDVSLTAAGSTTNLLTNPGFEGGTTPSTLDASVAVPNGWGVVYQTGNVPAAAGTVDAGGRNGQGSTPHSGAAVWDDGSVGSFDGIYQTFNAVMGQQYVISFFLSADDPFLSGTSDNAGVEMATYVGACSSADACTTALGGFTVQQPAAPTIATTGGDIAPNVYSLGSAAATASTVTFDGGTLQMSGGSFPGNIVAAPVILTARNGTVDTSTGGGGFSGVVSGSGSLTIIGGNSFSLTGANTYAGGTVLSGGTLLVGNDGALGTGPVTFAGGALGATANGLSLANAATLSSDGRIDAGAFDLTYAGAIAGPGALVKAGTGTLSLTSPNTYAGGTTVTGGTLAIGAAGALGSGPLTLDDGTALRFLADGLSLANAIALPATDPTIDSGSGTVTISGPITGPGALTKIGSGTLDLTGTNTYTGATEVAAGTLQVDGSIVNSAITVDNGARLTGTGSVNAATIAAGGTLSAATQALKVTGNVTFLPGSTYQATINPDGTGSRLSIGGTATVGGATLDVLAGGGTFRAATYTVLTAAGGVSGQFGAVTTATALALLRPSLSYTGTDVLLTLQPVDFRSAAATPNQAAVAAAIQALGPASPLYNAVIGDDPAAAQLAFAAASGVSHASVQSIVETSTRLTTGLVIDRLWDVSGSGLSAQDVLRQFAPDQLPTLVRCYGEVVDPKTVAPPATYTAWGEGFGSFGHTNAGANAGSLDRSLGGFILGVDAPLGRGWRGGVAGGYTNTSYTSQVDGGQGTVQSVYGSLYGGARYGAVDIRLGATFGGTFTDGRRTVPVVGLETERSHNNGTTVQTFGEIGYRFNAAQVVVEPVVGAAFLHVSQDGFTEKGGAAALTVAPIDTDLGTTTVGVRGEVAPLKGVPLVAHTFLGWQHVIGDVTPVTTLAFAAAPANTFSVTGTPIDRDALAAELALDYRATTALDLGLSYSGLIGEVASDHSVKGRVEYRF